MLVSLASIFSLTSSFYCDSLSNKVVFASELFLVLYFRVLDDSDLVHLGDDMIPMNFQENK